MRNRIRKNIEKGTIAGMVAPIASVVAYLISRELDLPEEMQVKLQFGLTGVIAFLAGSIANAVKHTGK